MNFQNHYKPQFIFVAAAVLFSLAAGYMLVPDVKAAIKPGVKYAQGNITLEAKRATVAEILEVIARTAGVDIYVARGFQPSGDNFSFRMDNEPLEEGIKKILRGYNYAAIYAKEGDDFRIVALKIYPEGQQGGEVVPLFTGSRQPVLEEKGRRGQTVTVLVNANGDIITSGNLTARRGPIGPSETQVASGGSASSTSVHTPWFALQVQQQQEESDRFNQLLLLRQQMEATTDTQRKNALSMAYADEVSKFQEFKRANASKIESLKRMNQFHDIAQ